MREGGVNILDSEALRADIKGMLAGWRGCGL
jgi:hypothetical protein